MERLKAIEKKHAETHYKLFERARINGKCATTHYSILLGMNDLRMQNEIKAAFGKTGEKQPAKRKPF